MQPLLDGVYDRRMAAALARGAAAAYGEDREMQAWAELQGCDGCAIVRDAGTDTLVFVAAAGQRAFVVFRGTTDLRNWLTDLDARMVNWELGIENFKIQNSKFRIHEGFSRALRTVWPEIVDTLGKLAPGRRNIYFTGHSLGGALAMLACARWQEMQSAECRVQNSAVPTLHSPLSVWLYTFGQPRVGNAAWARWYDARLGSRSFRVVHAEDIVPRVPWLLGAYRHAGTEIFFDALGKAHQDWPWWKKAPSDAAGLWRQWRRGKLALLGDHHVRTYVGMLNGKCGIRQAECGGQKAETFLRRSRTAATDQHGI